MLETITTIMFMFSRIISSHADIVATNHVMN